MMQRSSPVDPREAVRCRGRVACGPSRVVEGTEPLLSWKAEVAYAGDPRPWPRAWQTELPDAASNRRDLSAVLTRTRFGWTSAPAC
jgi:hypothetical protein